MPVESLEATEQRTFLAAADTGLWDLFIATFVSMFAIAPLLSSRLGDFWSSAVFLPVFAVVWLALRIVQQRIVVPRVGLVRFAPKRLARLRRFSLVMLAINLAALALGVFAAARSAEGALWVYPIVFAGILLAGFSIAAHVLGIPRLFAYGLLLALAPLVGEWLFRRGYATHHGYPVVYGASAAVIASCGLVRFSRQVLGRRPARDLATEDPADA